MGVLNIIGVVVAIVIVLALAWAIERKASSMRDQLEEFLRDD
jgi:hypothetical protein